MPQEENRKLTAFDFKDTSTRKRIEAWMAMTRTKISMREKLQKDDLEKIAELLSIITQDKKYKLPRNTGERRKVEESWVELCCWHVLKMIKEGCKTQEAIQKTAETLRTSEKTIEAHYYKKRKRLSKYIDDYGFENASSGFEHHLNWLFESRKKT